MDASQVPIGGPGKSGAGGRLKILVVLATAILLTVAGAFGTGAAASTRAPQSTGTGQWQQAIQQLALPGKGCFTAAYPAVKWQAATCKAAPKTPFEPPPPSSGEGPPPQLIGDPPNGTDYSAQVAGVMTSATGSFDSESSGVTESGPTPLLSGPGAVEPNMYSLQLNTQTFTTPACSSSAACVGWEQFVYNSDGNDVYVQYWLEYYNATCPGGWTTYIFPSNPSDIYCYTSSMGVSLTVGTPPAADLSDLTLTGKAPAGGTDAVVMTDGGVAVGTDTDPDSLLDLGNNWNTAEFDVFGDGWGSEATFSPGTDLKVRVTTHSGSKSAPTCVMASFTGESNSLSLSGAPTIVNPAPSPAMVSDQNTSPTGAPGCATASGIGDTHLRTFRDLLYDFQASGDFELATTGPGFVVQTRQVSGAPTWPNAAVNQAVAARVGTSDVAVCTSPTRLFVNDRPAQLASGGYRNLPGGGQVSLSGNTYLIRGPHGDSVTAQVNTGNPTWINVSVGLSRWPVAERGLLANAGTNADAIESRGGVVLTAPFNFDEFYGVYGNSWRVPASQSLLSPCGREVASGNPATVFYANNLPPELAKQAGAVCLHAGVRAAALLEACTVDVVMLHDNAAARAFLSEPADVTVGQINPPIVPGLGPRR
jgi:hypothetical protein